MRSHLTPPEISFLSKNMNINESGAKLLKIVIEEYIPKLEEFPNGVDPYRWLADHLHRNEFTIRKWTYDWKKTGAMPPVDTFFYLVHLSRSEIFVDFAKSLICSHSCFLCEKIKPILSISQELNGLQLKLEEVFNNSGVKK